MPSDLTVRRRVRLACFTVGLIICGLVAGDALAQQRPPYRERPDSYSRDDNRTRTKRDFQAGEFDYYVLALSWSPTYCADVGDRRDDPQCRPRGRPYAFVLHGLWPQFERGWPQNCSTPDRGFVPAPVAERMLDIMPSKRLVFHEYRKHGTCSGLGVDDYFGLARRLHDKVKIPPRFVGLTDERTMVSPGDLIGDFLAANPALKPDMIAVECGGPGNRLKEVRICFDKGGEFRPCSAGTQQRRLCQADRMYVPPVRAGAERAPDQRRPPAQRDMLPGPRDERRL